MPVEKLKKTADTTNSYCQSVKYQFTNKKTNTDFQNLLNTQHGTKSRP